MTRKPTRKRQDPQCRRGLPRLRRGRGRRGLIGVPTHQPTIHAVAYELADQFRAGLLEHLRDPAWPATWRNLVAELRGRCPGHHAEAYEQALGAGFTDSR